MNRPVDDRPEINPVDEKPRKRSRFGSAPPDKKPELPEDQAARARAIAERLSSLTRSSDNAGGDGPSSGSSFQTRKKVYFPDISLIGLLIGPKGQTHKQLEQRSGAKITIRGKGSQKDGDQEDDDELHALIIGDNDDQTRTAEKLVREILFDPAHAANLKSKQLRKLGSEGDGDKGHYDDPNAIVEEISISNAYVGAIIGKGGETIRDLQQRSHATIQIQRDADAEPGSSTRKITIKGNAADVQYAKTLVNDLIKEKEASNAASRGNGYGPGSQYSIEEIYPVDDDKVGLVIGKGGMTIRAIQEKANSKIQIPHDADRNGKRLISLLANSQDAIELTKAEIRKVLDPNSNTTTDPNSLIVVPDDKVGLIIGKGGCTIKQLQVKTSTQLQIPAAADPGSNPPSRTITITGAPQNVEWAKQEINGIVNQHQWGNQNQWGQQQQQQWGNQYQNQYWQQQQQQQQQQPQQQQQQVGGHTQEEVAQAWKEYYARMGQQQPQGQNAGQQPQQQIQQEQQPQQGQQQMQQAQQSTTHTPEQLEAWRQYYAQYGMTMDQYGQVQAPQGSQQQQHPQSG